MLKRYIQNSRADLPSYGPPPYDGSPFAWARFFLKPHTGKLGLYFGLNLVRNCFFQAQPFFLGVLVGLVQSGQAQTDPQSILHWLLFYGILSILVFAMLVFVIPTGRLIDLISKQISLYGFRHYLTLSESWHENRASGEKLQRLLTARDGFYNLMENFYWHVISIPGMFIAVAFSVFALQAPLYYAFMFYAMIASYLWLSIWTGGWMARDYKRYNQTLERVVGGVYEFVVSTATVRFFNLKRHVFSRGKELETENHRARIQLFGTVFKRWFLIDFIALAWILAIVGVAAYDVLANRLNIAAFTTIIFLNLTIWNETERLAVIYTQLIERWEAFKRLTAVLKIRPAITDREDAATLPTGSLPIHFENVRFEYASDTPVVHDFKLDIRPGEKIGLVGASGAGKSTIVKLLLRFYDVESGRILIGGEDIRHIALHSLQDSIAVIPQDITLFNHPLMENIRYGRLSASDEDVIEAARQAHADEFIRALPQGYNTVVGERGVKLSGGQRQRVAIARAILKNAPILVLDEATSALDSESERWIQQSLHELMENKTVIAIAHRLSTISELDRLIVMENGRIIEQGSHNDLLAEGGVYARLWAMQSGGFLQD